MDEKDGHDRQGPGQYNPKYRVSFLQTGFNEAKTLETFFGIYGA